MTPNSEPEARVVLQLRAITLELNLLGADFAAAHDLHVTDLRAIVELLDAERAGVTATPTWLADRLRLNSASVTALIDRLERMGHVERARDTADRRRVHVAVTATAKQLGLAFFGPLIGRIITAMQDFSEPETETIHRFLSTITGAISANQPPSGAPAGLPRGFS
jgi:DNA-binding MarR family transcriptional regulator